MGPSSIWALCLQTEETLSILSRLFITLIRIHQSLLSTILFLFLSINNISIFLTFTFSMRNVLLLYEQCSRMFFVEICLALFPIFFCLLNPCYGIGHNLPYILFIFEDYMILEDSSWPFIPCSPDIFSCENGVLSKCSLNLHDHYLSFWISS